MKRREFVAGAVALPIVAALNLPQVEEPVASHLFPVQVDIVRRARRAQEVYLSWGQRAGKSIVLAEIAHERLAERTNEHRHLLFVQYATDHVFADSLQHYLTNHLLGRAEPGWIERRDRRNVTLQRMIVRNFMKYDFREERPTDIFFEEFDWMQMRYQRPALEKARALGSRIYISSSPRSRTSMTLHLAQAHRGGTHLVGSHAATFEVNLHVTREALRVEELSNRESYERDFLAYRNI
jgi:hypothetical protein